MPPLDVSRRAPDEGICTLLVIRHGETRWNVAGRIQGHRDSALTDEGRRQADAVSRRLAAESIDALYCSDLGRTRETAAPVERAVGLAARLDAGLRERSFGIFESLTWDEIGARHPEEFARLSTRDPAYAIPGGESMNAFRDRIVGTFGRIGSAHPGERVAVVTHGGVLGLLYRVATGLPLHAPRNYTLSNAGLNRFGWRAGSIVLEAWGDVAHLEIARESGVDARDTV